MMTFSDRQLEEIAAGEAWLAEYASPAPADKLVVRIKAATRLAVHEQWLAEWPTAGPAPKMIAEIKSAVREELSRSRTPVAATISSLFFRRLVGVLSAAAMISLAVGVVRFAPDSGSVTTLAGVKPETRFLETLDSVLSGKQEPLKAIEEVLTALESDGFATSGNTGSVPDWDLNQLGEQIEDLGTETGLLSLFETS